MSSLRAGEVPEWARAAGSPNKGMVVVRLAYVVVLLVDAILRTHDLRLSLTIVLIFLMVCVVIGALARYAVRRRIRNGEGMTSRMSRDDLRAWGWEPAPSGRTRPVRLGALTLTGGRISWRPSSPDFKGMERLAAEIKSTEYTRLRRGVWESGYLRIVFRDDAEWHLLVLEYPVFRSLFPLPERQLSAE